MMLLDKVEQVTSRLETTATDLIAKIAPWAAPIPTACLVGRGELAIAGELLTEVWDVATTH